MSTELAARIAEGLFGWRVVRSAGDWPKEPCNFIYWNGARNTWMRESGTSLHGPWSIEDPAVMVEIIEAIVERGWEIVMSVSRDGSTALVKATYGSYIHTDANIRLAVAHAAAKAVEGER